MYIITNTSAEHNRAIVTTTEHCPNLLRQALTETHPSDLSILFHHYGLPEENEPKSHTKVA